MHESLTYQSGCIFTASFNTSWWLHSTCELKTEQHWTTKQRSKLEQQQSSLSLCGGLRNHKSIDSAAMGKKLALLNKRIQHCWSWLRQLQSISYRFVCILYSSRLILLYSRQTVENHLVHMGTSSYWCMHIMITISFFIILWLLFRSVCENFIHT